MPPEQLTTRSLIYLQEHLTAFATRESRLAWWLFNELRPISTVGNCVYCFTLIVHKIVSTISHLHYNGRIIFNCPKLGGLLFLSWSSHRRPMLKMLGLIFFSSLLCEQSAWRDIRQVLIYSQHANQNAPWVPSCLSSLPHPKYDRTYLFFFTFMWTISVTWHTAYTNIIVNTQTKMLHGYPCAYPAWHIQNMTDLS